VLVAYIVIFAVAFALRFWDLGARALHHDESIHAKWSWDLAQGDYHHSPIFHGPLYYHAQGLVFLIAGASDYTSRVSAAIFGMGIVAVPLLLRRWLGTPGTIASVPSSGVSLPSTSLARLSIARSRSSQPASALHASTETNSTRPTC